MHIKKTDFFPGFFIVLAVLFFMVPGCCSRPGTDGNAPRPAVNTPDPELVNSVYPMVHVKGGTFDMGDRTGKGEMNERPVHKVRLNDFFIGTEEVSLDLYMQFCGESGDHLPVFKDPALMRERSIPPAIYETRTAVCKSVCGIDWYDAVAFCNWLSRKLKLKPCYDIQFTKVTCDFNANGFRLPTEAEWEYAARGGHREAFQSEGAENAYGIKALYSDLGEWCWDLYGMDYYETSPVDSPLGIAEETANRVVRGCDWSEVGRARPSYRNFQQPKTENARIGFRLARNGDSGTYFVSETTPGPSGQSPAEK